MAQFARWVYDEVVGYRLTSNNCIRARGSLNLCATLYRAEEAQFQWFGHVEIAAKNGVAELDTGAECCEYLEGAKWATGSWRPGCRYEYSIRLSRREQEKSG